MSEKIRSKNPKGTRDFGPTDTFIREELFKKLKKHFELYNGLQIDTPVIECMDTVTSLYGEEFNKQVYTIDDAVSDEKDEESLSEKLLLRYDLTVPFARYIANNGLKVFRRYQIGKVYRRDQPQITNGRFREFYQADFDIVGPDHDQMLYDTECLTMLIDILKDILGPNTFKIKLNAKFILTDMLKQANVKEDDFNTICSSIDKLEKIGIDGVKKELINDKNISQATDIIDIIKDASQPLSINDKLQFLQNKKYISDDSYQRINRLFETIKMTNSDVLDYIDFDVTLSRGLDYYTGIIFEAVYNDKNIMSSTIAAGGRYDTMLGKLSSFDNIPAIGLSIGVERIVVILEKTQKITMENKIMVYVASVGKGTEKYKLHILSMLRRSGISCDMNYGLGCSMRVQFDHVFKEKIPWMVVVGETEISKGTVKLKHIETKKEVELNKDDLCKYIVSIS